MNVKRVTRDNIRSLEIGETGVFTLPSAKAVESGRVQFAMMKRLEGMEFERVHIKDPLTLAYKRLK